MFTLHLQHELQERTNHNDDGNHYPDGVWSGVKELQNVHGDEEQDENMTIHQMNLMGSSAPFRLSNFLVGPIIKETS